MKKLGLPQTLGSIPFSGFDDSKETTKAAQEGYARAVATHEKNDRDANARWEAIQKRAQGTQARITDQKVRYASCIKAGIR